MYERIMTTKEVIRTTVTISKRWQHLWTLLPNLIFIDEDDTKSYLDMDYVSFIEKTLIQSPPTYAKLNEFKLYLTFNSHIYPQFRSQAIRWIHHAITHRHVQKVNFRLWDFLGEPSQFIFDDVLFFNNRCFTDMKLCDCLLNPPPNGVIRWENLEILHLKNVRLDEDMIENIFSGTPCLECLEFEECYGYRRIDITSKSLMMFRFNTYSWLDEYLYNVDNYIDGIEINAPHLSALTIQGGMCLNKLLLLNVSSLIVVELIYWNSGDIGDPHSDVLLPEEEMLKGLLESLSHVNDISFGAACLEVLSRLEFKGFHFFEGTDDTAPDSNSSDSDLS
ncbi:ribonuclease H-like domain-containing protein [Tanacetum coccineum]